MAAASITVELQSIVSREVDPLEPATVAGAITWLLEHPEDAREMGQRGRETVLDRYSWEQEAKKLDGLYAKMSVSVS